MQTDVQCWCAIEPRQQTLSETCEPKVRLTIGLNSRTEIIISAEAKRQGITFADQVRRITDAWADTIAQKQQREKILVLDRDRGELRQAR
jgi:pantothenate kinase type III